MKISLYKILAVKEALESLNLVSIPVLQDDDIDAAISLFIVGLADREDDFNKLLNTITGENKLWSEDMKASKEALHDFFTLIPQELSVLMNQLRSVSSTLENAVMKTMMEEMNIQNNVENQEKEQN
jgi:hypothetical protein